MMGFARTLLPFLPVFMLLAITNIVACAPAAASDPCPPQGTKLTYENFGRAFFEQRCVSCHGGGGGGASHSHSYSSRAYVTLPLIQSDRENIRKNATGANPPMPPGPNDPSEDERAKLSEWLACGAP
jgi:mono/diheme cytochrome c family protein